MLAVIRTIAGAGRIPRGGRPRIAPPFLLPIPLIVFVLAPIQTGAAAPACSGLVSVTGARVAPDRAVVAVGLVAIAIGRVTSLSACASLPPIWLIVVTIFVAVIVFVLSAVNIFSPPIARDISSVSVVTVTSIGFIMLSAIVAIPFFIVAISAPTPFLLVDSRLSGNASEPSSSATAVAAAPSPFFVTARGPCVNFRFFGRGYFALLSSLPLSSVDD